VLNEAPPEALETASEVPNPISLESISACLPPEGQAWLNGLNPIAAVSLDLPYLHFAVLTRLDQLRLAADVF
jgi:hypothetical protein